MMKKTCFIVAIFTLLCGVIACNDNNTSEPPMANVDNPMVDTLVNDDSIVYDSGIDGYCVPLYFDESKFEFPYTVKDVDKIETDYSVVYIFQMPQYGVTTSFYPKERESRAISLSVDGKYACLNYSYENELWYQKAECEYGEFICKKSEESLGKLQVKLRKNDSGKERCIELYVYGPTVEVATLRFIQAAE